MHDQNDSRNQTFECSFQCPTTSIAPPPETTALLVATPSPHSRSVVLLATAWVTVESAGRAIAARALLDSGSERTFITENLAQNLCATRARELVSVCGVGGASAGTARSSVSIAISPLRCTTPKLYSIALVLKSLTSYAPKASIDLAAFAHLAELPLADPNPADRTPISLIISADVYADLILEGLRKGTNGQPIAQRTVLGWIISGPVNSPRNGETIEAISNKRKSSSSYSIINSHHVIAAPHYCNQASLAREMRRFWEIEELPLDPNLTPDEEQCEQHFRDTHFREASGRYVVRLPFKVGPPIAIGESHFRSEKLLKSLIRRLKGHSSHDSEYRAFLTEYEKLDHMRRAPASFRPSGQRVYIPHHAVIRNSSATTRLRVVFNASSLTTNGTTLNDHLHAGPKSYKQTLPQLSYAGGNISMFIPPIL